MKSALWWIQQKLVITCRKLFQWSCPFQCVQDSFSASGSADQWFSLKQRHFTYQPIAFPKLFSQSILCSPHMTSFLMPFPWLLHIRNYKWSLSNDHKAHSIDPIIHIGNWNKIMGWEVSWEYGNSCTSFHKLLTSIGSPPVGAIVGAILVVVVVVVLGITTGLIACR